MGNDDLSQAPATNIQSIIKGTSQATHSDNGSIDLSIPPENWENHLQNAIQNSGGWGGAVKRLGEGLGDVYAPGISAIDAASMGQLRPGFKALTGWDLPSSSNQTMGIGNLMSGVGTVLGAYGGLPSAGFKAIANPATALASSVLPEGLARIAGAIPAGYITGSLYGQGTPQERQMHGNQGAVLGGGLTALGEALPAAWGGIKNFFSSKPFSEELAQLPSQTAEQVAQEQGTVAERIKGVQKEYGTAPYQPGTPDEGKIGEQIRIRGDLADQESQIKTKYQNLQESTKDEFNQAKQDVETQAKEVAASGSDEAQAALKQKIKDFHDMYDERLAQSSGENITRQELSNYVRQASSNMKLGSRRILTGDEVTLKGLADEILPPKGADESASKFASRANAKLKANDIKAFFTNLRSRMDPTDHPLTEVYKSVGEGISTKMPQYASLRDDYSGIYKTIKDSKSLLGKGGIKALTQPTAPPYTISKTQALEEELGTSITGKARDVASKRQEIANQFKIKTSDLGELQDKELNQVYEKMNQSKSTQNNLIHEMRDKIESLKTEHGQNIERIKGASESRKNFLQQQIDQKNFRKGVAEAILGTGTIGGAVLTGGRKTIQHLMNEKLS